MGTSIFFLLLGFIFGLSVAFEISKKWYQQPRDKSGRFKSKYETNETIK